MSRIQARFRLGLIFGICGSGKESSGGGVFLSLSGDLHSSGEEDVDTIYHDTWLIIVTIRTT